MKRVSPSELQTELEWYLREVRAGEVVQVIEAGQVVAELRQPSSPVLCDSLERLCAEGLLVWGGPQDPSVYRPAPLDGPVASADLLAEEPGDR
jgi:hypothetical protein